MMVRPALPERSSSSLVPIAVAWKYRIAVIAMGISSPMKGGVYVMIGRCLVERGAMASFGLMCE
jgi:hypothetical protein